jgi:hypothetical protein
MTSEGGRGVSALALAVEQRRWPVVAVLLLLGVSEVAAKLPPETLTGLLEVLEERPTGGRK